jgi:hypothetical protein
MRRPGEARWSGVRAACAVALVIALAPSAVGAAPIPPALADPAGREADLAAIARALESRLVAAHLRTLGLGPDAIQARLGRLDDGELRRMAQSLPEVASGGQSELTGEQKAGVVLLLLIGLAVFGGLIYLTVSGSPF